MRAEAIVHARPLPLASKAATKAPETDVRLMVSPCRIRSTISPGSEGMPVNVPSQAPTATVVSDSEIQDMTQRQRGDSGLCLNRTSQTLTISNGLP